MSTVNTALLGKGYLPYITAEADLIFKESSPSNKLDEQGFLNLLQSQSRPEALRLDKPSGHKKTVQIRYKQRFTKEMTDTSKSCDNTLVLPRREATVELSSTRQIAIYKEDNLMALLEDEASKPEVGNIVRDLMDDVKNACNALLSGVNEDLLTLAVAQVGVNRVSGDANARTLNFPLDTTNNALDSGDNRLLSEYRINGGMGRPQVVGSGLYLNHIMQQPAMNANQSGYNTVIQSAKLDFYHDYSASTILDANQIIVYEPNAVQLVEYVEYTGNFAGKRPGASEYGAFKLPMQVGSMLVPVWFDWQLKYSDCPTTYTDGYYGTTLNLEKGWNIIISKQAGLFTVPSDSYRAGDVLAGNRGSYRYTVTNT